jgi:hypothetical protein
MVEGCRVHRSGTTVRRAPMPSSIGIGISKDAPNLPTDDGAGASMQVSGVPIRRLRSTQSRRTAESPCVRYDKGFRCQRREGYRAGFSVPRDRKDAKAAKPSR